MQSNQNEELYMLIISLKEAAIKEDNREERSPPSPLWATSSQLEKNDGI